MSYTIEVTIKLEGLDENQRDDLMEKFGNKIKKLAKDYDGYFHSFDHDINIEDNSMEYLSANYALDFNSVYKLKSFISNIPKPGFINFVHKNQKNQDIVIYSKNNETCKNNLSKLDQILFDYIMSTLN
jgi:hypothetical protein